MSEMEQSCSKILGTAKCKLFSLSFHWGRGWEVVNVQIDNCHPGHLFLYFLEVLVKHLDSNFIVNLFCVFSSDTSNIVN